jgi:hypothetical protein
MMRTANAVLATITASLTTMFLGQMAAVWDRRLQPYPHEALTPGQAADIARQIAVSKTLLLGAALAWLVTIGVVVARRMRTPTMKSVLAALAMLAALLTTVTLVYAVAIEVGVSQAYPLLALSPEQAAYRKYHAGVINALAWPILFAWLLAGGALFVWLVSLAVRRVRGQAGLSSPPSGGRPAEDEAADRAPRPGRFVRGFAGLQWWLSLAWLFLGERGVLSGLSRLRDLGDEAYMRQYGNPHLYARSESIEATAELVSGAILLTMTIVGFVLASGLRRGRAWSRWLALGQSTLLLIAGGIVSLSLMYAKSWKWGDAAQTMLPGLFLGLFTFLLWSPRIGAQFSNSAESAAGRPPH